MSNPWNKVAPASVQNLSDIMSEQFAKSIQLKAELEQNVTSISAETQNTSGSDEVTATVLQCQPDKEINGVEKQLKRDATSSISCNHLNRSDLSTDSSNDSDSDDEAVENDKALEYYETSEECFACVSKQSHVPKDKRVATLAKHDIINNRRFACNLLDERTRRILHKLIIDARIKCINGVISVGKESIILHASAVMTSCSYINLNGTAVKTSSSYITEYAIKVFKTTRDRNTPRNKFTKNERGFKTPLELALMRAELDRHYYYRFHVEHVVVMSFIGTNMKPAPNLKDAILSAEEWQHAYNQVATKMKEYYSYKWIHGSLVKNNVMWWNNGCHILGWTRSVRRDHPKSYKFLLRDCHNVCKFFKKKGVQEMNYKKIINTKEELFEWITGFEVAHFVNNKN